MTASHISVRLVAGQGAKLHLPTELCGLQQPVQQEKELPVHALYVQPPMYYNWESSLDVTADTTKGTLRFEVDECSTTQINTIFIHILQRAKSKEVLLNTFNKTA